MAEYIDFGNKFRDIVKKWGKGFRILEALTNKRFGSIRLASKNTMEGWANGQRPDDNITLLCVLNTLDCEIQEVEELLRLAEHPPLDAIYQNATDEVRTVLKKWVGKLRLIPPPRFLVPPPKTEFFVGREDDLRFLSNAFENNDMVSIIGVVGLGGIGKTELALHFAAAQNKQGKYPEGIFWLEGAKSLEGAFERLGADLFPDTPLIPQQLRNKAVSFLKENGNKCLLIIDNLENPQEIFNTIVTDSSPADLPCHKLITTRSNDLKRYERYQLGFLPKSAATDLLLSLTNETPTYRKIADSICQRLGFHALAITIAGGYIRIHGEVDLIKFDEWLASEGIEPVLDESHEFGDTSRVEKAVKTVLEEQWKQLDEKQQEFISVAALHNEIAIIPVARIALMMNLGIVPENNPLSELKKLLFYLYKTSLVERPYEDQVSLHPLVRDFVLQSLTSASKDALRKKACTNLLSAYQGLEMMEHQCSLRGVVSLQNDLLVGLDLLNEISDSQNEVANIEYGLRSLLRLVQREAHNLQGWNPRLQPARFVQQIAYRICERKISALTEKVREIWQRHQDQPRWWLAWSTHDESAALERTLIGDEQDVFSVAITAIGDRAVSCGQEKILRIWDLRRGVHERSWKINGHYGQWNVVMNANGTFLASDDEKGLIDIWDLTTGKLVSKFDGCVGDRLKGMAFIGNENQLLVVSDKMAHIWNLDATDKPELSFRNNGAGLTSVSVSADGQWMVTCSNDEGVQLWNLGSIQPESEIMGHVGKNGRVAIAADGTRALAVSSAGNLYVWNIRDKKLEYNLLCYESGSWPVAVAVSANGTRAITGGDDRAVQVWNLDTGELEYTLVGHAAMVRSAAMTSDGKFAVTSSAAGKICLWDIEKGEPGRSPPPLESWVSHVAISQDGKYVLSSSPHAEMKVWDRKSGKLEQIFSFSNNSELKIWVKESGNLQKSLSFTKPDGFAWQTSNQDERRFFPGEPVPDEYRNRIERYKVVLGLTDQEANWMSTAETLDNNYLVAVTWERKVQIWNLPHRELERTWEREWHEVMATPDGRFLVSGSIDRKVSVWDVNTRQEISYIIIDDEIRSIDALKVNDHIAVVVGCSSGEVYCLQFFEVKKSTEVTLKLRL